MKYPRSGYDQIRGMVYFPRMLDKVRLLNAGELPPDYHPNLGKGMDGRCCSYLHVEYAALADQVRTGATDEKIFEWCELHGRRLNEVELMVWNGFTAKRGWKDEASDMLAQSKERSGMGNRTDIQTFLDYFEVDEKRRA